MNEITKRSAATKRWADKAGRTQVKFYLPNRIVQTLDEMCEARKTVDPITGKERKIGRGAVVTALVDSGLEIYAELADLQNDAIDAEHESNNCLKEEVDAYISDLDRKRREADEAAGRLKSQATEIRILTEQLDTARNEIAVREEAASQGISIDDLKNAISKLPESALTPLSIALGNRANKLQGKR